MSTFMRIGMLLLFAMFAMQLSAQKIDVKQTRDDFNGQRVDALSVVMKDVDKKTVEKEWTKLVKGFGGKVSTKKRVIFADDASIRAISDNTVDVYARVNAKKDEVELTVAFDLGGAYLNKSAHSSGYNHAEKMIYEFAVNIAKDAVGQQVKVAEKALSSKEKALQKLAKDKKRLESDIEKYKKQIEKAEKEIKQNEKDQTDAEKDIESQKKALDALKKREKDIK